MAGAGGQMCAANASSAQLLPRLRGGVVALLNIETSVVGFALVEVQPAVGGCKAITRRSQSKRA
jgi:hypothetical protein